MSPLRGSQTSLREATDATSASIDLMAKPKTKPPAKAPTKVKPKQVSNPRSTSNEGGSYESRVQAVYLLAQFTGEPTALLPEGTVVGLQFQVRVLTYNTDDLVCLVEDRAGTVHKVLLQVKQTLKSTASNGPFREALTGAWFDFKNVALFTPWVDRIAVVYDGDGDSNVRGAERVSEFARTSTNGADFVLKVTAPRFSSEPIRGALATIEGIVRDIVEGPMHPDELRSFCSHLWFVSHRLSTQTTPEFADILSRIQRVFGLAHPVAPTSIWAELVGACQRLNPLAAHVTAANLDGQISSTLSAAFARHRSSGASRLPQPTLAALGGAAESVYERVLEGTGAATLGIGVGATPRAVEARASEIALPSGRPDAVNKVIGGQLDGINEKLKQFRYEDALADITTLGKDLGPFDAHQRAHWYLQRGACHWHLGNIEQAADDFLKAADLSSDDDKVVAARIRGLLLKKDVDGAIAAGLTAKERFPNSVYVWIALASARIVHGDSIQQTDAPLADRDSADVLQMLAWGRRSANEFPAAIDFSIRSLKASDAGFYTRHAALTIALEAATTNGVRSTYRLVDASIADALNTAVAAFEPRLDRLWSVQSKRTVADAASHLGFAYLMLKRPMDAITVAQEAAAHGIASSGLLRMELDALNQAGLVDKLKTRGREVVGQLDEGGLVSLAQAAAHAADIGLVDLAIAAAEKVERSRPDTLDAMRSIRWMGMYFSPLRDKAVEEVKAQPLDEKTTFTTLLGAARILLLSKDSGAAEHAIELATVAASREDGPETTLLLAELLFEAKRYEEASAAYAKVLPLGHHCELHTRWLHAPVRSGGLRGAKKLIESFPTGWAEDDNARSLAMELGQSAGDWALLKTLATAQHRAAPNHASSWLFKFMVAVRGEPTSALIELLKTFPERLEGSIQQVSQVAALELRHGLAENGMRRMYRLRRENMENVEAASAFLLTCCAITDELPNMEEKLPLVGPGCAVTVRDADGMRVWITLDPEPLTDLPETVEFKSSASQHVQPFIGRAVDEEVAVEGAFGSVRRFTVVAIESSHRRLLGLAKQAIDASLTPVPNAMSVPIRKTADGMDFSGVLEQLKRNGEHSRNAFENYSKIPITLGGLARLVGRSTLELVRGWPSDGPSLFVCEGTEPEIQSALSVLKEASAAYVIDAATLCELAALDQLDVLSILPKILVCSRTRDRVVGALEEAKLARSWGQAFEANGKLGFVEITPADHARNIQFLQSIADAIDGFTTVVAAYGPEEQQPLLQSLRKVIGEEDYSVLLVAAETGAHIFTVDGRLRSWAGHLQIQGVWPQVVLMHALQLLALMQSAYSLAAARMFLSNRSFVMLGGFDLALLCQQGTNWLKGGVARFKQYLNSDTILFDSVLTATLECLQVLSQSSTTMGAFGELLCHVTEGLARNKNCPADLPEKLVQFLMNLLTPTDAVYLYKPADMERTRAVRRTLEYLAPFIQEGLHRAKEAPPRLRPVNVKVLMVGRTPWLMKTAEDAAETSRTTPLVETVEKTPENPHSDEKPVLLMASVPDEEPAINAETQPPAPFPAAPPFTPTKG